VGDGRRVTSSRQASSNILTIRRLDVAQHQAESAAEQGQRHGGHEPQMMHVIHLSGRRQPIVLLGVAQEHDGTKPLTMFGQNPFLPYHPSLVQLVEPSLSALAHFYNLVPSQRRAQHTGHCRVAVTGETIPTHD